METFETRETATNGSRSEPGERRGVRKTGETLETCETRETARGVSQSEAG